MTEPNMEGGCTCRQVQYQAVTATYIFLVPRWRNEISLEFSATNTELTGNGLQC